MRFGALMRLGSSIGVALTCLLLEPRLGSKWPMLGSESAAGALCVDQQRLHP